MLLILCFLKFALDNSWKTETQTIILIIWWVVISDAFVFWCITRIYHFTDTFGPADVGLKEESSDDDQGHGFSGLNRVARWAQPITYLDIHECDSFTVSLTI